MTRTLALALAAVLGAAALPAAARDAGDWTLAVGAHAVDPASDNGRLAGGALAVDVGRDVRPTIAAEYFVRDDLGIEVLASAPFEHDIAIRGLGRVGSTRHLPPTVSVQLHFGGERVSGFVGAGVNYTLFFGEDTSGPLAGGELELDDSWGLAAHAGVDIALGRGALRLDARWIDIDADARLDGADLGTVEIDPIAYGAAYVVRF
ncbi:OmpW family protein [Tolypothrix campylonemoides VB511288]|nr:OmpW family protein [Tolypothrix campylonemoides VB511288]